MSLSSFIESPEVREAIKPLRPKTNRSLHLQIQCPPRTRRYALVGTAFDYLLRFELQRRNHHAVVRPWVAEKALDRIWSESQDGQIAYSRLVPAGQHYSLPHPSEIRRQAESMIAAARHDLETYVNTMQVTARIAQTMASHAIGLAHLDAVFRGRGLDPEYDKADPEDVQDLLGLLRIVPTDLFHGARVLLLNPTFGSSSAIVGGADVDIIADSFLLDIKTIKNAEIAAEDLDQLLGYYILSQHHRKTDPSFPEVSRVGFYLSRFAYLWTMEVSQWTNNPAWQDIDTWFIEKAESTYKRPAMG